MSGREVQHVFPLQSQGTSKSVHRRARREQVTMHWGTATKARGQNTEHDRIAPRQRCYLDDRVHDEQRQRAPLLCHRHRCRCHRRDIPGIWRLVWTRANQLTPLSRAHAKTEKKIGQQQIAVAATAALALARTSNRLLRPSPLPRDIRTHFIARSSSRRVRCTSAAAAGIANQQRPMTL